MMRAAVKHGPGDLRLEERAIPNLGPNDVLIEVKSGGICGTDVHVLSGDIDSAVPIVLGHEYAGVIKQTGAAVEGLSVGQPVISAGSWGCGTCSACRSGDAAACRSRRALGRSVDGSFAEYVAVPASIVHPLPSNVSFTEAQSIVGFATCVRGWNKMRPRLGVRVAIVGSGHAGMLFVQLARLGGASTVLMAGTRESRLSTAKSLGSDHVVNVRTQDVAQVGREITNGRGFDIVIESAGNPEATQQAVELAGNGGTVLVYGVTSQRIEQFETEALYKKDLTMMGTRGTDYPLAIELLASNKVRIEPLVTHKLPLDQVVEAFRIASDKKSDALRVVVEP